MYDPSFIQNTAKRYEVNATPTFIFFRNRVKLNQVSEVCECV